MHLQDLTGATGPGVSAVISWRGRPELPGHPARRRVPEPCGTARKGPALASTSATKEMACRQIRQGLAISLVPPYHGWRLQLMQL